MCKQCHLLLQLTASQLWPDLSSTYRVFDSALHPSPGLQSVSASSPHAAGLVPLAAALRASAKHNCMKNRREKLF